MIPINQLFPGLSHDVRSWKKYPYIIPRYSRHYTTMWLNHHFSYGFL